MLQTWHLQYLTINTENRIIESSLTVYDFHLKTLLFKDHIFLKEIVINDILGDSSIVNIRAWLYVTYSDNVTEIAINNKLTIRNYYTTSPKSATIVVKMLQQSYTATINIIDSIFEQTFGTI